jgi:hypothetical protein
MVARMATNTQIAESTLEHALALSIANLSAFDGVATSPFREHLGTLSAALHMPVRSVDVRHVWRSGTEWHVETEVTGDEGTQTLMLRYLDGEPPQMVGGAVLAR